MEKDPFNLFAKLLLVFLGSVCGFIALRLVIIPIRVATDAMEPSLKRGDYVCFLKSKSITNGSIILYKNQRIGYGIGRVIAKSGDNVEIVNKQLYINGIPFTPGWKILKRDSRIFSSRFTNRDNLSTITVPNGYIFILNDNWDIPNDSRMFGVIPVHDVVGKYVWSLSLGK